MKMSDLYMYSTMCKAPIAIEVIRKWHYYSTELNVKKWTDMGVGVAILHDSKKCYSPNMEKLADGEIPQAPGYQTGVTM